MWHCIYCRKRDTKWVHNVIVLLLCSIPVTHRLCDYMIILSVLRVLRVCPSIVLKFGFFTVFMTKLITPFQMRIRNSCAHEPIYTTMIDGSLCNLHKLSLCICSQFFIDYRSVCLPIFVHVLYFGENQTEKSFSLYITMGMQLTGILTRVINIVGKQSLFIQKQEIAILTCM